MAAIVYRLDFPDGSFYIGATTKNLTGRMANHLQYSKAGKSPLAQKLRECPNPSTLELARFNSREEAWTYERELIQRYPEALNQHPGGPPNQDMLGNTHKLGKRETEETRRRKSKALKGNQHRKGIPHSEETKARISASSKGKLKSEQTKQRMREAWARKRGEVQCQP